MRVVEGNSSFLPSVIFIAQLKITHNDGNFSTSDDENDQHDEEKTKHEV